MGGPLTVGDVSAVLLAPPTGVKVPGVSGVLGTHSLFVTGMLSDSVTPDLVVCDWGGLFVVWWQWAPVPSSLDAWSWDTRVVDPLSVTGVSDCAPMAVCTQVADWSYCLCGSTWCLGLCVGFLYELGCLGYHVH